MNIQKIVIKKLSKLNIKKDLNKIRKIIKIINPVSKKTLYNDYNLNLVDRNIKIRTFGNNKSNIIIFLHGGGWATGNADVYTQECENLSKNTNHTVILVDYRLAPENKFPKGLEDCYEVVKLFYKDNKDIILMGDSAGGNLACGVTLKAMQTKDFKIKKLILLYPSLQSNYKLNTNFKSVIENGDDNLLTRQNLEDYMDLYVKEPNDLDNPLVSPLNSKMLKKMPKSLIIVGDKDPLRDEAIEFSKINKKCKLIIYKNAIHGFMSNPFGKNYIERMYNDINKFIGE